MVAAKAVISLLEDSREPAMHSVGLRPRCSRNQPTHANSNSLGQLASVLRSSGILALVWTIMTIRMSRRCLKVRIAALRRRRNGNDA